MNGLDHAKVGVGPLDGEQELSTWKVFYGY